MNPLAHIGSVSLLLTLFSLFALVGNLSFVAFAQDLNKSKGEMIVVGEKPSAIAVNPTMNKVYVANALSNSVSVIDGSRNTVIDTIKVGGHPLGIAVNQYTNKIYVTNFESVNVSVIDGETDKVIANISNAGFRPYKLAIDTRTNLVYVASSSLAIVSVIDGSTDRVLSNITLNRGMINGIAVNPNTGIAYVTHDSSNFVSIVDISSGKPVEMLIVGDRVFDVAVDPTSNSFYVLELGGVSVIDGSTNRVLANITLNSYMQGAAVNSRTNIVYVADGWSNSTTVIDASSNIVEHIIDIPNGANAVALNQETNTIYVANHLNSITVIDGSTNRIIPEFSSPIATVLAAASIMGVIVAVKYGTRKKTR